ncbi:unnamed protein product, partial [Callosobruchus maculatus]
VCSSNSLPARLNIPIYQWSVVLLIDINCRSSNSPGSKLLFC